jgi:hypothetical protein
VAATMMTMMVIPPMAVPPPLHGLHRAFLGLRERRRAARDLSRGRRRQGGAAADQQCCRKGTCCLLHVGLPLLVDDEGPTCAQPARSWIAES